MQKIYFIEDSVELRRMYERILSLNQCEVIIAPTAGDALSDIRAMTALPDAIVLDAEHLGTRGRALLQTIKTDERLARIPLLVLSNTEEPDWREELMDTGTDHLLVNMHSSADEIIRAVSLLVRNSETSNSIAP